MKKDYLKEGIEKKSHELWRTPEYEFITKIQIQNILNEGAAIQREFDAINYIQESYCIDTFEEAKEVWIAQLENNKLRKIHEDKNETIPVDGCSCSACINQTIYNDRMQELRDSANAAAARLNKKHN